MTPRSGPIIFAAPMVRAILADAKTKTRRICKLGPDDAAMPGRCPYGVAGDTLYVRERFAAFDREGQRCRPSLAAYVVLTDGTQIASDGSVSPHLTEYAAGALASNRWRPSIHMPRWASRITLEVIGVRVERVQEITNEDAIAEGARSVLSATAPYPASAPTWSMDYPHPVERTPLHGHWYCFQSPRSAFANLWISLHGSEMWDRNPLVWVVSFRRVT